MSKKQKRVLIIDDDSRNIFALKAVLSSRGYECEISSGALEGIEKLSDGNVGIVLLDMMMPEMDGYEAIRAIRQGTGKNIPIVSVTAEAMVGDRERCLEAGADEYLSKPIDVDKLITLLNKFMQ